MDDETGLLKKFPSESQRLVVNKSLIACSSFFRPRAIAFNPRLVLVIFQFSRFFQSRKIATNWKINPLILA